MVFLFAGFGARWSRPVRIQGNIANELLWTILAQCPLVHSSQPIQLHWQSGWADLWQPGQSRLSVDFPGNSKWMTAGICYICQVSLSVHSNSPYALVQAWADGTCGTNKIVQATGRHHATVALTHTLTVLSNAQDSPTHPK